MVALEARPQSRRRLYPSSAQALAEALLSQTVREARGAVTLEVTTAEIRRRLIPTYIREARAFLTCWTPGLEYWCSLAGLDSGDVLSLARQRRLGIDLEVSNG